MIPVAIYDYYDRHGRPRFQRVRYEQKSIDPETKAEFIQKQILWRYLCPLPDCGYIDWSPAHRASWSDWDTPEHWHWSKPDGANSCLYEKFRAESDWPQLKIMNIWVVEGEKDADSLHERLLKDNAEKGIGPWAVITHPNGAEVGPYLAQVMRVASIPSMRVNIVMDRDEAGAYNAWRWWYLLRSVGVPDMLLRIYRPDGPVEYVKDVTDHLTAGLPVSLLMYVPVDDVKQWAAKRIIARAKARGRNGGAPWQYKPGNRVG